MQPFCCLFSGQFDEPKLRKIPLPESRLVPEDVIETLENAAHVAAASEDDGAEILKGEIRRPVAFADLPRDHHQHELLESGHSIRPKAVNVIFRALAHAEASNAIEAIIDARDFSELRFIRSQSVSEKWLAARVMTWRQAFCFRGKTKTEAGKWKGPANVCWTSPAN